MKLFAVLGFVGLFAVLGSVNGEIGADLESSLRIVYHLCNGGKDEPGFPEAFYACYDLTPGKVVFDECQIATFGSVMNSLEEINKFCEAVYKIVPYTECVVRKFFRYRLDILEASTIVNVCHAGLLEIE